MPFTFDNKISLGTVVTVASLAVGMVWFWATIDNRVAKISDNDVRQDNRLEAMASTVSAIKDTVTEQSVDIRYIRNFVEDERRNARTAASQ